MPFGVFMFFCRCIACYFNMLHTIGKYVSMVSFVVLNLVMVRSYGCLKLWLGGQMPISCNNELLHSKNRSKSAL